VTETEWQKADLEVKLQFLWGTASERKLRLFACACCRSIWDYIEAPAARRAIEIAERFADGQASKRELADAQRQLAGCLKENPDGVAYDAETGEVRAGLLAAQLVVMPRLSVAMLSEAAAQATNAIAAGAFWHEWNDPGSEIDDVYQEEIQQAQLLADIIGNPFRPEEVSRRWLTSTVVSLARAIYDERQFQNLPILADALEDAGCDQQNLFRHCRQPGEHARGCWAVDSLLGKD
jgi:hypothetical protein